MQSHIFIFIVFLSLLLPSSLVNTSGTLSENDVFGYKPQSIWNKTWEKNETAGAVRISTSIQGNIFIAEGTPWTNPSVLLLKYDSNGDYIWNRTWKNNTYSQISGIAVDKFENIYMAIETNINGALVVFNSSGDLLWTRSWSGVPLSLNISNNSIYVAGKSPSDDTQLLKFNMTGGLSWEKDWDSGEYDQLNDVVTSSDNKTIYCTGITGPQYSPKDVLTLAYNSNGILLWNKTFGGTGEESGNGISVDSKNNVYVSGMTETYSKGIDDVLLLKYNSTGVFQWYKTSPPS